MKHCIIVKFIPEVSKKLEASFIQQIQDLFNGALELDGIHYVKLIKNCVHEDNRADLMIQIEMDKPALETWNKSDVHLIWKKEYDRFIDTKTIFDYED